MASHRPGRLTRRHGYCHLTSGVWSTDGKRHPLHERAKGTDYEVMSYFIPVLVTSVGDQGLAQSGVAVRNLFECVWPPHFLDPSANY